MKSENIVRHAAAAVPAATAAAPARCRCTSAARPVTCLLIPLFLSLCYHALTFASLVRTRSLPCTPLQNLRNFLFQDFLSAFLLISVPIMFVCLVVSRLFKCPAVFKRPHPPKLIFNATFFASKCDHDVRVPPPTLFLLIAQYFSLIAKARKNL